MVPKDVTFLVRSAYMQIYHSIRRVIEELDPSLVVVDMLLNAGFDACYSLNREFVMSSPNNALDIARKDQPWLKGFWRYPLFVLPSYLL